jgi:hypothetical protein
MVRVEPIIFIEKAEKVAFTKKSRCANDAMAYESIFPGRIRQFYNIDLVLTDRSFDFDRRIRVVDNNQVLDRVIALIGYTLNCTQYGRITRRGANDCYEGLLTHSTFHP